MIASVGQKVKKYGDFFPFSYSIKILKLEGYRWLREE
nr:MAG TPA: hypothetical protein [Caudoviricetes sp.]DAS79618.1 MAG TPA: hypothetical protein [Caudoviricetes sp.]